MVLRVYVTGILLLLMTSFQVKAEDRFITKLTLATGQTVVVAEGDFEARSIGSFSVRLYEAALPQDKTTFFTAGLIHSRDGFVETVILADLDSDELQEIIVTVRSAGTGGYLSAHAFSVDKSRLLPGPMVTALAADADPVLALRNSIEEQK